MLLRRRTVAIETERMTLRPPAAWRLPRLGVPARGVRRLPRPVGAVVVLGPPHAQVLHEPRLLGAAVDLAGHRGADVPRPARGPHASGGHHARQHPPRAGAGGHARLLGGRTLRAPGLHARGDHSTRPPRLPLDGHLAGRGRLPRRERRLARGARDAAGPSTPTSPTCSPRAQNLRSCSSPPPAAARRWRGSCPRSAELAAAPTPACTPSTSRPSRRWPPTSAATCATPVEGNGLPIRIEDRTGDTSATRAPPARRPAAYPADHARKPRAPLLSYEDAPRMFAGLRASSSTRSTRWPNRSAATS
jgi:hypothetical protein